MAKIDEMRDSIVNAIHPKIKHLFSALNNEMKRAIEETQTIMVKAIDQIASNEENAKIIRRNIFIRRVLRVLVGMASVAGIFGPNGEEVGSALTSAVADVEKKIIDPKIAKVDVPAGVTRVLKELETKQKESGREIIDSRIGEKLSNKLFLVVSIKSMTLIEHGDVEEQLRKLLEFTRGQQLVAIGGSEQIVAVFKRAENALAVIASSGPLYKKLLLALLKENLDQLEFNLQANLILAQHARAVDAFRQAVSPFAADYLDIYQLPTTFAADGNFSLVVATVSDKIKTLSARPKLYNST